MKNKFTLGAIAGLSSVALAIPILAQVTSAQNATSASPTPSAWSMKHTRSPLTIAQIQSMIDRETTMLANIDAFVALQKTAMQAHKNALTAALSITDDTQRQAAVDAAHQAMRKAMDDAFTTNPALKSAMGGGMMMGGRGHHGKGMMGNMRGKGRLNDNDMNDRMQQSKTSTASDTSGQ